jgi:hypothetical protein
MRDFLTRILTTRFFLILSTMLFVIVIALTIYLALDRSHATRTFHITASNTTLFTQKIPSPAMSVKEVVRTQLLLLRHNRGFDEGIWGAYKFTSSYYDKEPEGYKDFVALMHSDQYSPLLNFRDMYAEDTDYYQDKAFQMVWLETGKRTGAAFLFELSRYGGAPAKNCWLVTRIRKLSGRDGMQVI